MINKFDVGGSMRKNSGAVLFLSGHGSAPSWSIFSNDVISPYYSSLRENRANTHNIFQYQEITSFDSIFSFLKAYLLFCVSFFFYDVIKPQSLPAS